MERPEPTRTRVLHVVWDGEPARYERAGWRGRRSFDPTAKTKANIRWMVGAARPKIRVDARSRFGVKLTFATASFAKDLDNFVKIVLDALSKYVWADDQQVDELVARVYRGKVSPSTEILIYTIDEAPQIPNGGNQT